MTEVYLAIMVGLVSGAYIGAIVYIALSTKL